MILRIARVVSEYYHRRVNTGFYEGRVRTLCANGANRPVSGRILDQKAVRAGQIRSLPLYFYRFKRSAYNELTITAHARDVA